GETPDLRGPDWTAGSPEGDRYGWTQPRGTARTGPGNTITRPRLDASALNVSLDRNPSPAYYVGNNATGTTYRSYSLTPSGSPSRSVYVGSTQPGTPYGSYSLTPSARPGASRYVGNSMPGTSYGSYSPSRVNSIGNYGYG